MNPIFQATPDRHAAIAELVKVAAQHHLDGNDFSAVAMFSEAVSQGLQEEVELSLAKGSFFTYQSSITIDLPGWMEGYALSPPPPLPPPLSLSLSLSFSNSDRFQQNLVSLLIFP